MLWTTEGQVAHSIHNHYGYYYGDYADSQFQTKGGRSILNLPLFVS